MKFTLPVKAGIFLALNVVLVLTQANAQEFDVTQFEHDQMNDLMRGGRSGQSFTSTQTGYIHGVRLLVQGAKWSGDYPYGSDFSVNLRRVIDGVVQSGIIATGFASRDQMKLNDPTWIDVYFEIPYHAVQGEVFAFTLAESSSGSAGWSEYGMKRGDVYAEGQQFYDYSTDPLSPSEQDMAFGIIVSPQQQEEYISEKQLRIVPADQGKMRISLPVESTAPTEDLFVLQHSADLVRWTDVEVGVAVGGVVEWVMELEPDQPRAFYRVKIVPDETTVVPDGL